MGDTLNTTTSDSAVGRLALYARVSTDDGRQSTDNQKPKLIAYAESKNMPYDLFVEQESTAKHRPVKEKLLTLLRNKKYTAVVVNRMDRWCRSVTEMLKDLNEIVIEKNLGFISLTENLDFHSPHGRLVVTLLGSICQYEREVTVARTKDGLARAIANGKKLGRPKGRHDTPGKPRRKSGYFLREARKRQLLHQQKTGEIKSIEEFISNK